MLELLHIPARIPDLGSKPMAQRLSPQPILVDFDNTSVGVEDEEEPT